MRIEELIPGMSISLLVTVNNEHLTFESKIQEVYPRKRLVLADAIIRNNKVLSLHGENLIVDVVVNSEDDVPQIFKNVTVTTMRKGENSFCYNLATDAESKTYNRRQNFRCYVGLPTAVQLGMIRVPLPATIRVVSSTGFSIVCDRDYGLEPGAIIHADLKDHLEETDEYFKFEMYGLIARVQELENGNVLYGCRLNNSLSGLDAYIMKKERLRLRKSNGGNL